MSPSLPREAQGVPPVTGKLRAQWVPPTRPPSATEGGEKEERGMRGLTQGARCQAS